MSEFKCKEYRDDFGYLRCGYTRLLCEWYPEKCPIKKDFKSKQVISK